MSPRMVCAATLWIMIMLGTALAAAAPAEVDLSGVIRIAEYRASAFAYRQSGSLLWLEGPDGLVRVEIRAHRRPGAASDPLPRLLSQEGQGWTAILGGHQDETIGAWGDAWRQPPPGLAGLVMVLSRTLLAGPPPGDVSLTPWRSARPVTGASKHRINSLDSISSTPAPTSGRSDFRGRLTARGFGRGGSDELLVLNWDLTATDNRPWLRARSTRRPGQLELYVTGDQPVIYAMPETFVPLWPLAQLVRINKN